jgi:hypothetical protein
MAEGFAVRGAIIHSLSNWPCRVCRPRFGSSDESILLCRKCAEEIAADVIGAEGRRPAPEDFASDLVAASRRGDGWALVGSWSRPARR